MPRVTTPLTDTEIKRSKPKDKLYKLGDGKGLFLVIRPNGTKFFRFDYSLAGKRQSMSFGIYPEVTLKEARKKREETRTLIKQGIDPVQKKRNSDITTFKHVTEKWLEIMKNEWAESTYKKAIIIIQNNTYPFIGNMPMEEIKRTDILNLLKKMENRGILESADRLLNYIERIYKYAVTYNIVEHNIIADIDKKNALKKPAEVHFSAITKPEEVKALMEDIKGYGSEFKADISVIYALQLAPYVFLRPYNLRFLIWDEVDFDNVLLDIPAHKMKTKKDFVLPLCDQAVEALKKIMPYSYGKGNFVFPSPMTTKKPISEATVGHALKRLGYKGAMTPHGFRAMFSTNAYDHIKEHGCHSDIIESCLAHVESNKVKAAYSRDSKMRYIDEKRVLLNWWGKWLNEVTKRYAKTSLETADKVLNEYLQ